MTTEQVEEVPAAAPLELEVPFVFQADDGEGGEIRRTMWVRMPQPEKLLVWQRTLDRLANVTDGASWTSSEVMVALERLRKIVDSLLVNRTDVTWIDDQFLDGTLTFRTLTPIIAQTLEAFQQATAQTGNREQRRETDKAAKKAARKKAPK